MKKFFVVSAILALVFAGCDGSSTTKAPSFTIDNQSSYILTNVMFSGVTFSAAGSNDLPISTPITKEFTTGNEAGYITFTRKDTGINLRTIDYVSLANRDSFIFTNNTMVEEQGNLGNTNTLGQINFIPNAAVVIQYENNLIQQNGLLNAGEALIGLSKQIIVTIRNTGTAALTINTEEITISGDETSVFTITTNPSGTITVESSSQLIIEFKPMQQGEHNAILRIPTNDNTRNPIVVYLQATAIQSDVNWDNEPGGEIIIVNNTDSDIVIFHGGGFLSISNMLGGVKAGDTREFFIFGKVSDFFDGGSFLLRGMTLSEYHANRENLNNARIVYTEMAIPGLSQKFQAEIPRGYIGDFGYRVTNNTRLGLELRRSPDPDSESVAYIPPYTVNQVFYTDSSNGLTLFPVFVLYNRITRQLTRLYSNDMFSGAVTVMPRLADDTLNSYSFSLDGLTIEVISPAYVTVKNNTLNIPFGNVQFLRGLTPLRSQTGFDIIQRFSTQTFEIRSSDFGEPQNLMLSFFEGTLLLPVLYLDSTPILRNGYDYTITVTGSGNLPEAYQI